MTSSLPFARPRPLRYPALVWLRPGRLPWRFDGRRLMLLALAIVLLTATAIAGWLSLPRAVKAWINTNQYRALVTQRERLGERYNLQVERLTALRPRIAAGLESVTRLRQILALPPPSSVRGVPVESSIPPSSIYTDLAETRVQAERTVRVSLGQWGAELAAVEAELGGDEGRLALTPTILPLAAEHLALSSDFGRHRDPLTETTRFHNGMLLAAAPGSRLVAPAGGEVVFTGIFRSSRASWQRLGEMVVLRHGEEFITILGHCDRALVSRGQSVRRGDAVAEVGDSGMAPHHGVYYEVRKHRPELKASQEPSGFDWVPVDPKFFILDASWRGDAQPAPATPQEAPEYEPLPYALRR